MPSQSDVAKFEAALLANESIVSRVFERRSTPRTFERWTRSFVGIIRSGKRTIYGDYLPTLDGKPGEILMGQWGPGNVCDGGPAYFGAEFDIETGTISHFAFNGVA